MPAPTAPKPNRAGRPAGRWLDVCALPLVLGALLAACGGGGASAPKTMVAQPVAVVLRPGEADIARLTASEPGLFADQPLALRGEPWLSALPTRGCARPDPLCAELPLAASTDPAGGGEFMLFREVRADPTNPDSFGWAWMPVIKFPETLPAAPPALAIAANDRGSFAIDADGAIWRWGGLGFYRRNDGPVPTGNTSLGPLPTRLLGGTGRFVGLATGRSHLLALAADGSVYGWGANGWGSIDPTADTPPPESNALHRIALPFTDVVELAATDAASLALRSDGSVWVWGAPALTPWVGGFADERVPPRRVAGLPAAVAIRGGAEHALALAADGTVWGWGQSGFGETATDADTPTVPRRIPGLTDIRDIAAGAGFSLALRSDGSVWGWGRNDQSQLGHLSTETCDTPYESNVACTRVPRRVGGAAFGEVASVVAGDQFALARLRDGTLWAWGRNDAGQVAGGLPGLGFDIPRRVPGLGPVLAFAAGSAHALAMPVESLCDQGGGTVSGRLLAWGENIWGQRGDGAAVAAALPTPVLTLGDDDRRCVAPLGERLLVYLGGPGRGRVTSDQPGLQCAGILCWQTLPRGSAVQLTGIATDPAEPANWRWDCGAGIGVATTRVVMDGPRQCKLRFAALFGGGTPRLTVAVTGLGRVTSLPAGLDCGSTCMLDLPVGTEVTLTAIPPPGWTLRRFTGDGDCIDGRVTMRAGGIDCGAEFGAADGFALVSMEITGLGGRVVSTPAGLDCDSRTVPCVASFPIGAEVQLTATPLGGWFLLGDALGGDPECVSGRFVVRRDTVCTATFARLASETEVRLDYSVRGPGAAGGSVAILPPVGTGILAPCPIRCSATIRRNTVVTLTQFAARGSAFSHWVGCDEVFVGDDDRRQCRVVMNDDRVVEARFEVE